MHLMSKNMDPNFTFFLKQFDKLDLQLTGVLSLQAYIDILTKILPNTDIVEIEARYQLAEKEGEKDQVPIEKLAIISCYLMLNNSFRTDYRIVSQISLLYRDFKSTSFGAESMDHLE
jgi:hypothetical protein